MPMRQTCAKCKPRVPGEVEIMSGSVDITIDQNDGSIVVMAGVTGSITILAGSNLEVATRGTSLLSPDQTWGRRHVAHHYSHRIKLGVGDTWHFTTLSAFATKTVTHAAPV